MRSVSPSTVLLRLLSCFLFTLLILSCSSKKSTDPPPTPPESPTQITATALSPWVIQLGWQNHGDYDSVLVGRKSSSGWQTLDARGGSATQYADSTCSPAVSYYYRIAGKTAGLISWSPDSVTSTTPAVLAPAQLRAIGRTGTSITLQWQDRSTNESGFKIYRHEATAWLLADSVAANRDSLTVHNLLPVTAYSFRVTAFNQLGESDPSNQVDTTTRRVYLPVAPGNVTTHVLTPRIVRVGWEDRGDCLAFLISRRSSLPWMTLRSVADGTTQFIDSTALPTTHYWYRVGAQGDEGIAWSADSSEALTYSETAPSAPTDLRQIGASATTVTLTWIDHAADETGFRIYWFVSPFWRLRDSTAADHDTVIVGNLNPSSGYVFRVTASNPYGESAPTNDFSAWTDAISTPTTPHNITAEALSANDVFVHWQGQSDCFRFLIARKDNQNWVTVDSVISSAFSWHDYSVMPNSQYWYRVGAVGSANVVWSADSGGVQTPMVHAAPHRPDSLHVDVHYGCCVELTWRDNSDDETGFLIERAPLGQTFVRVDSVAANVTSYTDSLLGNYGLYNYQVRAKNDYGVSQPSAAIEADYRGCSDGVIPICEGNYWVYQRKQGSNITGTHTQRITTGVADINGHDYHLVVEDSTEHLYYLYNFPGLGCSMLPYPVPDPPTPQILYRYPAQLNDRYAVGTDTMLVTALSTAISFEGTIYTGLVCYQRVTPVSRYTIWVKPETIGVVKVDSLNHSGSIVLSTRELIDYHILNMQ